MPLPTSPGDFVRWFRDSSPYIHAHRGKTFVVSFGGEAVADDGFPNTIHDFAMLNGLGVRLVLVHGIRPQIDARLSARGVEARYHKGLRITDKVALECVKEAAERFGWKSKPCYRKASPIRRWLAHASG